MRADDSALRLDASDSPEFDRWRWVDFWYPPENVVSFKRQVYWRALVHLAPAARRIATGLPERRAPEPWWRVRKLARSGHSP